MAAIPTGQDDFDTAMRHVHVARAGDVAQGYPTADERMMLVPFGTAIFAGSGRGGDLLGTVLNGTLTNTADRKTRPDGVGGVEEITYANVRWEAQITATFRQAKVSTSDGAATGGTGPLKPGDIILLVTPASGQTFAAPSTGTVEPLATAWVTRGFTVDEVSFKFSDGEYATYDVKLTHEASFWAPGSINSAEVDAAGNVLQLQDEALNL